MTGKVRCSFRLDLTLTDQRLSSRATSTWTVSALSRRCATRVARRNPAGAKPSFTVAPQPAISCPECQRMARGRCQRMSAATSASGAKADHICWHGAFLLLTDCVEKLICASERERLIQDQATRRNNDSRTALPRFSYCQFPFHGVRSATFSTQSTPCRHHWVPTVVLAISPLPLDSSIAGALS